jgi:hypothetical protein
MLPAVEGFWVAAVLLVAPAWLCEDPEAGCEAMRRLMAILPAGVSGAGSDVREVRASAKALEPGGAVEVRRFMPEPSPRRLDAESALEGVMIL